MALPFPIDEANGHAKFDKSKRELIVTLPVIPPVTPPHPHIGIQEIEKEPSNEVFADNKESGEGLATEKQMNENVGTEGCKEEGKGKEKCENEKGLSNGHLDNGKDDDDNHDDDGKEGNLVTTNGVFVNADDIIDGTDMAWDNGDLNLPTSPKEHDLHFDMPSNLSG